jgi:S1-C subfamily serine protease
MPRRPLYSSTRPVSSAGVQEIAEFVAPSPVAQPATGLRWRFSRSLRWVKTRSLWIALMALAALCAALSWQVWHNKARELTQKDIDAAVLKTLTTQQLPSQAAAAYENVRPSIVRVVSFIKKSRLDDMKSTKTAALGSKKTKPQEKAQKDDKAYLSEKDRLAPDLKAADDEVEFGVGTGVVIVDKGIILTNWHVVQGADRIKITFMDGLEAEADVKSVQAEDDLAVLQARKIPDDLIAATMRSTADLAPGDHVVAVGFPFGIGPSASAGIVSGLKRSFRSPDGGQTMKNLIQFDAAANPGNSGGPLVTMDGEVVGIVTAIMNPTSARTFIGIGFAVPIENAASAAGLPPF